MSFLHRASRSPLQAAQADEVMNGAHVVDICKFWNITSSPAVFSSSPRPQSFSAPPMSMRLRRLAKSLRSSCVAAVTPAAAAPAGRIKVQISLRASFTARSKALAAPSVRSLRGPLSTVYSSLSIFQGKNPQRHFSTSPAAPASAVAAGGEEREASNSSNDAFVEEKRVAKIAAALATGSSSEYGSGSIQVLKGTTVCNCLHSYAT